MIVLVLSHKVTGATGGIPVYLALLFFSIAVAALFSKEEFEVFSKSITHIKTTGDPAELTYRESIVIQQIGRFQDILIWALGVILGLIPARGTIMVSVLGVKKTNDHGDSIQMCIAILLGGTCYALIMIFFWTYSPLVNYSKEIYDLLVFGP